MWGAGSPKNVGPVSADVDVAPVAATTAGRYIFTAHAVRPVPFYNNSGGIAYIYINKTDADPTATAFHVAVANGGYLELSFGGAINVKYLRIWYPTLSNTPPVVGWQ